MLDSRLLHKTVSHLIQSVTWLDGPLIDWKYHGLDNDLNFERIRSAIDNHLKSSQIYLVYNRTDSSAYNRNELESHLNGIIGCNDFTLWNIELTRVIEFNKIGVYRLGELELIGQAVKDTFSYFDKMGDKFPTIQKLIEEEDLDMVFSRMEIFAEYTNANIAADNKPEIIRCFEFQESEYLNMNELLLNALSVSYCEALLLGENSSVISEYIELMPTKLKKHYLDYEHFYTNISN